jgi:hypothetical protein
MSPCANLYVHYQPTIFQLIFLIKSSQATSSIKWLNGVKNQRFKDHLCLRPQSTEVSEVPIRPTILVASCWAQPGILCWTCYPIRKLGETRRALDSTHQCPLASAHPWTHALGRYIYGTDENSSHFSTLRMRTEMVLEMLVFSPFNHLMRLVDQEDFIIHSHRESSRSYMIFLSFCKKCLDQLEDHFCNFFVKLYSLWVENFSCFGGIFIVRA